MQALKQVLLLRGEELLDRPQGPSLLQADTALCSRRCGGNQPWR